MGGRDRTPALRLAGIDGWLWLEFDVPRLESRIYAGVVSGAAIVPIEFKVGAKQHARSDSEQAWDYALDLKNFHRGSHASSILAIVVATEAADGDVEWQPPHSDSVRPPRRTNADWSA